MSALRAVMVDAGYFEVHDGDKWWSLKHSGVNEWFITNRRGQIVNPNGPLGKRLIVAVLER